MPILAQTLHGYEQGHRLLASAGDLDARELSLLDRLSDLSGYLPTGTRFDRYYTGFPCGRYYALACTWTDLAATRAGTVLTHTVLLPLGDAGLLEDPWGLTPLHRRPRGATDRDAYRQVLSMHELPVGPPESLGPEEKAAVAVLLLGTLERPILWVDERQPEAVVRFLWSLLDPEQRRLFAFCTFALQPRSVEGRVFDFLGLPPAARGSFLDRARSEAWWDSGQLLHPRMAGLVQQPWVTEIAQEGAAPLRRMEAVCQSNGFRKPQPKEFTTFWRFMSLEAAASERLAAARARVDLFERLWPEVKSQHPAVASLLQMLLDRQADAPVEPRPLWELTDFLKRPLVQGRRATDSRFASEVEQVLVRELERRFEQTPERTAQELPELLAAMAGGGGTPLLDAIQRLLTARPDASVQLAPSLLRTSVGARWPELVNTTLAVLPSEGRQQTIDTALAGMNAPAQEHLLRLAEEAAERLDDVPLLLVLGRARGRELEVLQSVTQRLLARDGGDIESRLSPVLSNVAAPVRLGWALDVAVPLPLAWFSAREGVRAAKTLGIELEALVQLCVDHPNGARLLLLFAQELPHAEPLRQALRLAPGLALELVVLTLNEDGSRVDDLARMAAELVPAEQLLSPALHQALLSTYERRRARALVDRLGSQWVRALCEDVTPLNEMVEWLALPVLRQWLETASRDYLLAATAPEDTGQLLPRMATVLAAWLDTTNSYDTAWLRPVLVRLLRDASTQSFDDACQPLSRILPRVPSMLYDDTVSGDLLARVERTRRSSGWRIVELVFPRYYARACREEKSWGNVFISLLTGKDWDKAKPVRHWLLGIYIQCDWPPESFLRALDGDVSLFARLVHKAAKSREGMDFLHRLPSALEADTRLASRWRRPIEEALANPHRSVDYE